MPTVESIESWRGQDVLDSAGEKAGRLEDVYYDAAGDQPVLISIKHGRLGHHVKLAPVSDAAVSRDFVRLPFTGEQLRGAPDVTVGDELTAEQCAAVLALFAVRQSSGALVSASLLVRRNDEAEQARRRADELELTAEDRKREAEEARHRAGAASEEAHAAQRAREQAEAAAADPGGGMQGSD
ncbi:MAG: PRC-barrel domain-containing protein [Solirubrobacteraceae bacterium]